MLDIISAFLAGAALVLVVELCLVYRWFQAQPYEEQQISVPDGFIPVSNPQYITNYCSIEDATESETCMFLNLIFQFLWKEWRDSPNTRNFFMRRMNLEFQEMLLNKAAGKLMEQITVRDYHLGDSLPVIKKATVMKIDFRIPTKVPREIDVALDIEYSGGFIISLEVDLIFGKSTHFTVKLNSLQGRLRLQFTRIPCTHWSFSFYEDPVMDLQVDSNFQGRNLPKLTSFIHSQIRRAIKKKHTFPHYKVRYKPFFIQQKPQDGKNELFVHSTLLTVGSLDVEVVECTRLMTLPRGSYIYCTLSVDSLPWKEDMPLRRSLWPVHEVLICRSISGAIGVSFYREFEMIDEDKHEIIAIKAVSPNSPASKADIQKGDILLSVNNVDILSMKQAVRLVKNAGNKLTFKIQRPPLINNKSARLNNNEIFERAVPENNEYDDEVQESFDYNSIMLQDDESDTEEFVNIVVHEIGEEILSDDSTRKQFYETVRRLERASSEHTIINTDDSLSNESLVFDTKQQRIDRSNSRNESLLNNMNPSNNDLKTSYPSKFSENNESKGGKLRPFCFFKKNKDESSQPILHNSQKSSSGYTTDISDNVTETNSVANGYFTDVEMNKRTYAPSGKREKQVKVVGEKSHTNNHDRSSEPLGIDKNCVDDSKVAECDWDNISNNNIENVSELPVIEDEKETTGQKTTLVNANEEPVFNEIFSFDIEKEHKHINICVWGKCEESFDKDMLLGYVSIPLIDLAVECLSTSSRKSIQTFPLATTSDRSTIVNRSVLRTMVPGLNISCCNGDITLAFKYASFVPESDLESEDIKLYAEQLQKKNETNKAIVNTEYSDDTVMQHNFVAGEFYFPTICEYCQNKVWRKVAFQCAVCTMICHKRCIQKAQANTYCTKSGVRAKPPAWQMNTDISCITSGESGPLTTEDCSNSTKQISLTIPDENNLRPGIKNVLPSSHLLRRRKVKLNNLSNKRSEVKHIENNFNYPIMEDNREKDCDYISTATVTAKEAGRELFASLDETSRESNIQGKVEKLQHEIDFENEQSIILRENLAKCKNIEMKERIQIQLRKSEERNQALALLMIQYCAALKECLVMDEPQHCDL